MGVDTLTNAPPDGQPITEEFLQGPVAALKGDIVPRPGSGVPTASSASLGTGVYPFSAVYADRVVVKGQEISTGGESGTTPGGPGSVTAAPTIRNGVVSGLAPAGRPGMCGWLHQAGSSGVVVTATTGDPLRVKLDGTTYTRTSNITGGTLPADYSQTITPVVRTSGVSDTGGGTWVEPSLRATPPNADRARYRYATGGEFAFHDQSATEQVPDSYGNNLVIKSTGGASGTSYTYCQRVSDSSSPSGSRNLAKLKMGECWNTSSTAQIYPAWQLPFHTTHRVIRCGALFVDPLTATWSLTISARIVGAVNTDLPSSADYVAGDVVFLESDQRWHRHTGSGWAQTSFVFLAFLAIDGGEVEAVMPVRTEDSLSAMFDKKYAVLGDPVSREGEVDGELIRFGGQRTDVEGKGFAELGGQQFNQQGTSAVVDTGDSNAGTLTDDEMFCVYLDVATDDYHFEAVPPVWQIYRQRLLLVHPSRQRLYVGSFVTDDSGGLIAAQSLSDDGNQLNEGNDDSFRVANPSLFGRSRLTDLGQPEDRRMQIQVRGKGTLSTGTNTYRYRWRGTRAWWPGHYLNKERWDELFFSYLTPHVTEQIEFDTDNNPNLVVEFSQWDEASLLYAAGLTEAAREGRNRGVTGAAQGDVGGVVASVDTPQLAPHSVGHTALGLEAVDIDNLDTNNEPAAGLVLEVTADPDDASRLRLFWGDGSGSGITPFQVGGTKEDGKFIRSTGTEPNQQTWDFLRYGNLQAATSSEADIFDNPTQNTGFVGNKTLFDAFGERDRQLDVFWGDWALEPVVEFGTIPGQGTIDVGGITLLTRNTSAFNVGTSALTAGELYLAGTNCTGAPTLSSGTLRAGLLWLDSEGRRFYQPIDNPESPDGEEFFLYTNGAWHPQAYNSDLLISHARGLYDDARWNGTASHLIGGPTGGANAFNDEAAVGQRDGHVISLIRVVYSTSDNEFHAYRAHQAIEVPIADGQIITAMLAPGAVGTTQLAPGAATGSKIAANAINSGKIAAKAVDFGKLADNAVRLIHIDNTGGAPQRLDGRVLTIGGSGTNLAWTPKATFTKDTLWSSGTPVTSTSSTQTLSEGRSFADWDMVYFKLTSGSNSYYTAFYPVADSIGDNNELIDIREGVNLDILTNTTWKLDSTATGPGVVAVIGVRYG